MLKQGVPIKLFVDAHVFDKEYQGSRTFIKEIYSQLAGKKDLAIYLGACNIDILKDTFSDSGNINFIKYKSQSSVKRLLYDIPSILEKYKIDYAHFQYIVPPVKKCRYIVTIHDALFYDYPDEFPWRYKLSKKILFKQAASKADILTTVSSHSKKAIEKYLRPGNKSVHVIPNGVNKKYFLPYNKSYSQKLIKEKYGIEKFILYVSRFEPRKNHISLLKAYLDLKLFQQQYFLVFLGHKSLSIPEFESAFAGVPEEIRKFIFISSQINDEELLEFYRAASVFVYPSLAEGFGISPLEAGALKIPVICSNTSAMAEFSFFDATHIDPSNTDLLKRKLFELISDPPDKKHLSSVSNIIYQKYSWEESAETFHKVLLDNKNLTATKLSNSMIMEQKI